MHAPDWYPDPWQLATFRWWDGQEWTGATSGPPPYRGPEPPDSSGFTGVQPTVTDEPEAMAGVHPEELARPSGVLAPFLGGGSRLAVIDVETTGLARADRIVEIAVVTLDASGRIVDEFDTLVDPGRDVGPTWIHQITASMLRGAPRFDEVAHHVAAQVHGAVCVAHNLPFEHRMVGSELDRAGIGIDWGFGLDTLSATGTKLGVACADYDVPLAGAHRALVDARATAHLLVALAEDFDAQCRAAVALAPLAVTPIRVVTRDGAAHVDAPAPYLAELARGLHASVEVAPYAELLDRAIADLRLTADERAELGELAADLGMDGAHVARAHREFLDGLIDAALDDEVLTDDEYDQLCRAAALLDLDLDLVARRCDAYRSQRDELALSDGLQVCFTGDARDPHTGVELERDDLEALAQRHGLIPTRSVTAAKCDLLVAADPDTQSGKATKARKFGTPITSLDAFLSALDSNTPLPVTRLASAGVPLVCVDCGRSWLAARNASVPRCADCKPNTTTRRAAPATTDLPGAAAPVGAPQIETLTCVECGASWERERVRGRKPHRCPSCA